MDEKFLIVSGKDRLILAKGVDAVHKMIQGEGDDKGKSKGPSSSHSSRSKSPNRSPALPRRNWESQRSHSSPQNSSYVQRKGFSRENVKDQLHEDLQKLSRGSPKARAFGNNGVKCHPAHSKSPSRSTFAGDAFNSYDVYHWASGMHNIYCWEAERHEMDTVSGHLDFPVYPQTLEELEAEFKKEAMEIVTIRDKEEDEENYRHREPIRELRKNYMKQLKTMRALHAKQLEEFLQLETQRQQRAHQHLQMSACAAYNLTSHSDFERSSGNPHYLGGGPSMNPRSRYQYPGENYSAPSPCEYGEFQHQRRQDFSKAFGRN